MTRIVVAVPTLNEAVGIEGVLTTIRHDLPDARIVVIDGGSTDETVKIALASPASATVLHNPRRWQSAGMNQAAVWARASKAEILIRADAHSRYAPGFFAHLIETLDRTGADSVVVPLIAEGLHGWHRANARLQQSWLGNGGASHRRVTHSGPVNHGHHAAFRLSRFLAVGGYDPTFMAAEDIDLDQRFTNAGMQIYLSATFPVSYSPRNSLRAAFEQYYRNGVGRARFWRKHHLRPAVRQFIPITVCAAIMAGVILSPLWSFAVAPAALYALVITGWAAALSRCDAMGILRISSLAAAMHFGFALGALSHLFTHLTGAKSEAEAT